MRKKSLMSSFGGSHLSKRRAPNPKDDPFEDPDSGLGLQRKSREEDISMSQYRKKKESEARERDIDRTNDDPNSRMEVHTDQKDEDTSRMPKKKKTRFDAPPTNDEETGLGQFQRKKFRKTRSDIIPPAQAKFVGFKLNNTDFET